MPHRKIHKSRCGCFVFPSCGVIQLAYMNPMELKLIIQLGSPCSQITSFQGFPKGCWLRLAFEALPTIPVIATMRKLFFVASLHHRPRKKNFKQVSMASILCQKQRCPCAFSWEAHGLRGCITQAYQLGSCKIWGCSGSPHLALNLQSSNIWTS